MGKHFVRLVIFQVQYKTIKFYFLLQEFPPVNHKSSTKKSAPLSSQVSTRVISTDSTDGKKPSSDQIENNGTATITWVHNKTNNIIYIQCINYLPLIFNSINLVYTKILFKINSFLLKQTITNVFLFAKL